MSRNMSNFDSSFPSEKEGLEKDEDGPPNAWATPTHPALPSRPPPLAAPPNEPPAHPVPRPGLPAARFICNRSLRPPNDDERLPVSPRAGKERTAALGGTGPHVTRCLSPLPAAGPRQRAGAPAPAAVESIAGNTDEPRHCLPPPNGGFWM